MSDACAELGMRSLSEFVRQAVFRYALTRRTNRSLLSDDLTTVTLRLRELDKCLHELTEIIARVLGPAGEAEAEDSQKPDSSGQAVSKS